MKRNDRVGPPLSRAYVPEMLSSTNSSIPVTTALLLLCAACASAPPQTENLLHYSSLTYGFTFTYPDSFDLKEYIPEFVAIGRAEGERFTAAAEVVIEEGESGTFEDFVAWRAQVSCAADGPGTSLHCGAITAGEPFSTHDGEEGVAFHLEHRTTRPGTGELLERSTRGPYFALRLPQESTGPTYRAILIRAPATLTPQQTDKELIRGVAESLR